MGPAYILKLNIKGVSKIPKRFNDVLIYQRKFCDYVLGSRNDICALIYATFHYTDGNITVLTKSYVEL